MSYGNHKKRSGAWVYRIIGALFLLNGFVRLLTFPSLSVDIANSFNNEGYILYQLGVVEILFDLFLATLGLVILKYLREAFLRIVLVGFSFILFFGTFEVLLRAGFFDGENNPAPFWIPPHFKEIDKKIDEANAEYARKNRFFFTDEIPPLEKPAGTFRIAVVGDSFVFGDGIPYDKTWGHRLKALVKKSDLDVEVLSWGQNGWSTLGEWKFIRRYAKSFGIDLIILGWNANDPDLYHIPQKQLKWQESSVWNPMKKFIPYSFDFVTTHLNHILEKYLLKDYGYLNWVPKIYAPEELKEYDRLLSTMSSYLKKNDIGLVVVFTPGDLSDFSRDSYFKIAPLLQEAGIHSLNLFPEVYENFHHLRPRDIWANRADRHPGEALNAFFAEKIFAHLKDKDLKTK